MSDGAERVEYTVSAFKKAGFVDGGRLMLLAPSGDHANALEAFRDTVAGLVDEWIELEADDLWIRVQPPSVGPDGPLAYVEESEPGRALTRMLADVAHGLEQRGISGKLKPAPIARPWYFGSLQFPAWNAVMRFRAPTGWANPSLDWDMDQDHARTALRPLVDWMLDTDGPVYVSNGASFTVPPEEALSILLDSVRRKNSVWVDRNDGHRRRRQIHVARDGYVSLVHYDADRSRLEILDELDGVLQGVARMVTFAFVRDNVSHGRDLFSLLSQGKHPAPIAGGQAWNAYAFSMLLEADFVYDANVSQVITTRQLSRTRLDPQSWTVRDLGGERHLVRHLAPEAWYEASPFPVDSRTGQRPTIDPGVLTSAREDFHDAILTRPVVLDGPSLSDPKQEARRAIDVDPSPEAKPIRRVGPGMPDTTAEQRWWDGHAVPTLSAVILLPIDLESLYDWPGFEANHAWHVNEEVTRAALQPALGWALSTDGPVVLSRELVAPEKAVDLFIERLSSLPDDLRARTAGRGRPWVERSPHGGLFRRVSILDYGMAVVHSYDVTRSKEEQLDDLVAILTAAAPHLAAGFVREVPTRSVFRHHVLVDQKPAVPYGPRRGKKAWHYAGFPHSAHLESEFVYDAFVAQVITQQQFMRTRLDPARWDIAELEHQRFLVRSRMPTQWFDQDPRPIDCREQWRGPSIETVIARRPSPVARKVLDAARTDFREAIMTAETVELHPPDLPSRHQERFELRLRLGLGTG